jgi:hypothetical protein
MLDILKKNLIMRLLHAFSLCSHPTADIINKAIEDGEKSIIM